MSDNPPCNKHAEDIATLKVIAESNEKRQDRFEKKQDSIEDKIDLISEKLNGLTIKLSIIISIVVFLANNLTNTIIQKLPLLLATLK